MNIIKEMDTDGNLKEIIEEKSKEITAKPPMYLVLLHNDHYTTMEFVIEVLVQVFHKSASAATKIMLDVHRKGIGRVGVYTYDIAATKVAQVRQMAKSAEFPLKCTIEEETI
jgi:ATP-dependent Clp protease adaptor protein ClpS